MLVVQNINRERLVKFRLISIIHKVSDQTYTLLVCAYFKGHDENGTIRAGVA